MELQPLVRLHVVVAVPVQADLVGREVLALRAQAVGEPQLVVELERRLAVPEVVRLVAALVAVLRGHEEPVGGQSLHANWFFVATVVFGLGVFVHGPQGQLKRAEAEAGQEEGELP